MNVEREDRAFYDVCMCLLVTDARMDGRRVVGQSVYYYSNNFFFSPRIFQIDPVTGDHSIDIATL